MNTLIHNWRFKPGSLSGCCTNRPPGLHYPPYPLRAHSAGLGTASHAEADQQRGQPNAADDLVNQIQSVSMECRVFRQE